uniref:Orphan G-protein coupled receptor 48 n=1 Tax=Platynereis dumerilii TaxID=6359 RepID=A0A0K0PUV5_PLADU|nr:orphan G-protein coupled receptor 48 [Platynereis dumerilii]
MNGSVTSSHSEVTSSVLVTSSVRFVSGMTDIVTFTSNVSVTSQSQKPPSDMPAAEAIMFIISTAACICATIIGNILVIMSVFTYKPLKNVANFFIVSLAVADLAVAILVMPFNVANFVIGHWVFGVIFCNMWLTFDILTCTASILNLCAIAMDRYFAIHDPINYAQKRTSKRVVVSIIVVWGASAVISIPPLIGWNNSSGKGLYDDQTGICQLTDAKGFVLYSSAGSFYIPLFIMSFVYINIFIATRRRLRQRAQAAAAAKLASVTGRTCNHNDGNENVITETSSTDSPVAEGGGLKPSTLTKDGGSTNNLSSAKTPLKDGRKEEKQNDTVHKFYEDKQRISLSRERRAARTMAVIMAVFVICWLPFFLMYVIFPFCQSCAENTDHRIVNFIVWLGYINSCLNPIIYTIFNIDFRRAFSRLLQGKWRT